MILLSSIIQLFEAELLAQYQDRLLPSHRNALAAMKECRTSASPMMLAQCTDCDHRVLMPHSCGHRSCPHCQLAPGVNSHVIGTARAFQINDLAGSFSALAMGLMALVSVFALPFALRWVF
jgi:hypothetical protein